MTNNNNNIHRKTNTMARVNTSYARTNAPRLVKAGKHVVTNVRYTENKKGFGGTMWLLTNKGEHGVGHAIREDGNDYDQIRRLGRELGVEDVPGLDKSQRSDVTHHNLYRLLVLNIENKILGKPLKFTESKNVRTKGMVLLNVEPA